jgi:hypothetical protein
LEPQTSRSHTTHKRQRSFRVASKSLDDKKGAMVTKENISFYMCAPRRFYLLAAKEEDAIFPGQSGISACASIANHILV